MAPRGAKTGDEGGKKGARTQGSRISPSQYMLIGGGWGAPSFSWPCNAHFFNRGITNKPSGKNSEVYPRLCHKKTTEKQGKVSAERNCFFLFAAALFPPPSLRHFSSFSLSFSLSLCVSSPSSSFCTRWDGLSSSVLPCSAGGGTYIARASNTHSGPFVSKKTSFCGVSFLWGC